MAQSVNFQINKVDRGMTINYTLPSSEVKRLNNTNFGTHSNQVNEIHLNSSRVDNYSSLFNLGGGQSLGKPIYDDSPYTYSRCVRFRSDNRSDSDNASDRGSDERPERNSYSRGENYSRYAQDSSSSSTTSPRTGYSAADIDHTYWRNLPRFETVQNMSRSRYDVYYGENSRNLPRSSRHSNEPFSAGESPSERHNCNIRARSPHYQKPFDPVKTRNSSYQTPYISGFDRNDLP